jgi:Flp pilus assembly CpaF family ATPase
VTGPLPGPVDPGLVRRLQGRVADVLAARRNGVRAGGQGLADEDERQLAQAVVAEVVAEHVADLLRGGQAPPPGLRQRELVEALHALLFGAGRLQPLLDDPQVEDILINGCDEVWLTLADGRKVAGPPVADTDAELVELVQTLGSYAGLNPRPFDAANPQLDLRLPDGSRLSATQRVCERPAVAIRRHRLTQVRLSDLVDNATLSRELAGFLTAAVRGRQNVVIAGETGAGKTTLLRALVNEIDPGERLIVVESSRELNLRAHPDLHPDVVEFEAVLANSEGRGGVGMAELVRRTLRMAPDRVIVGEVLGPEIVAMMNAMSQGNDGSLTTIHADSPRGVFHRIAVYAMQAAEQLRWDTAHALIAGSVDFVVYLRRHRQPSGVATGGGSRRVVTDVLEVAGWDSVGVQASAVFAPGPDGQAVRDPGVHVVRQAELAGAGWDPQPGMAERRPVWTAVAR